MHFVAESYVYNHANDEDSSNMFYRQPAGSHWILKVHQSSSDTNSHHANRMSLSLDPPVLSGCNIRLILKTK